MAGAIGRPSKYVQINETSRKCCSCGQIKPMEGFAFLGMGERRRADCKKCHSDAEYQRRLERQIELGSTHIGECKNCERLFKRHSSGFCVRCRKDLAPSKYLSSRH